MMRLWQRKRGGWLLPIFIAVAVLCFHNEASAHAYIVKSVPEANQSLQSTPRTIQIWFDEPVQAVFDALTVVDENGTRVDLHDAHIDKNNPDLLECGVKPGLADGIYTVNWRVISADGHPVQGVIPFSVGASQPRVTPERALSRGYLPGPDMVFVRWLQYLSMVSYLGLLVFRFLILPKRLAVQQAVQIRFSRMLWTAWWGIAVSVMFSLPVQTKVDAGVNLGQALSPQLLETVLIHTEFGSVWMAQVGLVVALLLATLLSGLWQRTFGLISGLLAIGLLVSKSLTGHEATTFHPAFTVTLDVLHLFAASVWVGGLLGLVLLVPWSAPITVEAGDGQTQWQWESIRRFSPWGISSVLILMLTGMFAAFQQIPTTFALFHTAYGKTLILKLCLFLMMLGLGVYHWSSRYLSERNPSRDIYPSIWIEFGLGALILIVTAVVANLPTPMSTPGPVLLTRSLGNGITATLHINPNVAGTNAFAVELKDKSGKPYTDVQQVTLTFASLDTDSGSDTVRVPEAAPGEYKLRGIYLTSAGHWDVRVHLLTNALQDMDADFRIVVGSPQGD